MPKKWKHRKIFVKKLPGKASKGTEIVFGDYGLKAVESGYITNRQLEAARKVIIRRIRKIGKIWFRVFPDVPLTKKGLEMPMGKGKGDVVGYAAPVKRGKIILEINGVDEQRAKDILIRAGKKLPIKVRFVKREEIN